MSHARHRAAACTLAFLLVNLAACAGAPEPPDPLTYTGTAYALAGTTQLAQEPPQELPGLHNVFHLSDDITSGSEPDGEAAFAQLASMGIKTILSVDGKRPDAEAAARHGLRYVHIPIQYKGIAPAEMTEIAKTFRELDGPFYVHCFHGKHRGPAAAEVGRLVLDGTSRTEALAEMRQWCGTAPEYEGLYHSIATAPLPDEATTASLAFDFPAQHPLNGVRGVMIPVPRAHDHLKAMAKHGWAIDPANPDVDPVNEAEILAQLFESLGSQPEVADKPEDFQDWMHEAQEASRELRDALRAGRAGLAADEPLTGEARARTDAAMADLSSDCKSCHAVYRDR